MGLTIRITKLISIFNEIILECINQHAPLRKIKLTIPVVAWMNNPEIRKQESTHMTCPKSDRDRDIYFEEKVLSPQILCFLETTKCI